MTQLTAVAAEVNRQLAGGVVQKVYAPSTTRVYLEVRVPGRSALLLVTSDSKAARLSAVTARPANPPTPPGWQSVLRRELTGAKLADAEAVEPLKTLLLHLTKQGRFLTLVLELTNAPCLALLTGDKVLTVSSPARPGLRPGVTWKPVELPGPPKREEVTVDDSPGVREFLPLLHSIEARFGQVEQRAAQDAHRAPILSRLKKLRRTIGKVREEAGRGELAQQLKREGELLAQNLHALRRGEKSVTLTEYATDGTTREVSVTLDPRRSPQKEVEHRFHQYRRLTRGVQFATERLAQLEAEEQALVARLDEPAPATLRSALPPASRTEEKRSLPYRTYLSRDGHKLFVGRGAARNDELTFHVARPWHYWLHVRGQPGAHVVIPLEKNQELPQELLLDAAHLAAWHSDAKGEPRVEVSYVPVKYVRKAGAPGAVTYTREKTLLLKVEAERLKRLLASGEP